MGALRCSTTRSGHPAPRASSRRAGAGPIPRGIGHEQRGADACSGHDRHVDQEDGALGEGVDHDRRRDVGDGDMHHHNDHAGTADGRRDRRTRRHRGKRAHERDTSRRGPSVIHALRDPGLAPSLVSSTHRPVKVFHGSRGSVESVWADPPVGDLGSHCGFSLPEARMIFTPFRLSSSPSSAIDF